MFENYENFLEYITRDVGSFDLAIREAVRQLIGEIENEGYLIQSVAKNAVILFYKDYSVCTLSFLSVGNGSVFINMKKITGGLNSIQKKAFFNKFWKENVPQKQFKFNGSQEQNKMAILHLVNTLSMIRGAFIDDIVVDFQFDSIHFKDYRCFESEFFKFNDKSTVLLGANASGKTSILDALTVSISAFLSGINEKTDFRTISKEDVRFTSKEEEGAPVFNYHPPTVISVRTLFINNYVEWSRKRNSLDSSKLTTKDSSIITNIVRQIVDDIRDDNSDRKIVLPIFSYHGTGRVANFTRDMGLLERAEKISRFMGYRDCLKPASNYKFFLAWFRKMKLRSFEMQKQIPSLNAVADSILKCLQILTKDEERKIEAIRFIEGQIHVKYLDGRLMPISYLSDGYKDVIGIVSDIAYRMAILNPHLGENILNETPGVVLVDEVDLHLHPKWQQNILYALKTIFPKVQFITTTHSALIISSTEECEAVELIHDGKKVQAKPVGNPKDWYISDILAQAFHVNKKPLYESEELGEPLSLEEKLKHFSGIVKEYLANPDVKLATEINDLYNELIPSLPEDSPKRRAIESLKGLVK